MGGRPPRVTATPAKSMKRPREEDEGAELANVEGGTLTGHWPRRVKPPAERTSPRKKGFLSSPVHVDVQRLRCRARTASKRHSWSPSLGSTTMARLLYAATISSPFQGRRNQIDLGLERAIASDSSNVAENRLKN